MSSSADPPRARASVVTHRADGLAREGELVAIGARDEAGKLIPIDLKAGDRVLFGKWSGTES